MKGLRGSRQQCEAPGCDKPAKARGLCVAHYERERGRHRHRPERMLHTRARSRALTILAERHRAEFEVILNAAYAEVLKENNELEAVAKDLGAEVTGDGQILKLRPGPRPTDEEPADRISVVQSVRCLSCQAFHEKGHKCHACAVMARGARPELIRVPTQPKAGDTSERIKALIVAGHEARWIVDQGYSRADVTAVLRKINAERTSA